MSANPKLANTARSWTLRILTQRTESDSAQASTAQSRIFFLIFKNLHF